MQGVVTDAVNVRGEHRGQQVTRLWAINSIDCHGGSVCQRLLVTRNRGPVQNSFVILHRIGVGLFRGSGVFWVPLECLGRWYSLGSRAPYTITLRVSASRRDGAVRYATRVSAVYTNLSRSDSTRCPLGLSHDAARYRGRLVSKLPPYSIEPPG